MGKGPRVHPDIEKRIAKLVCLNPLIKPAEVENLILKEFGGKIPIPAPRTIGERVKHAHARLTVQEKPWSLSTMIDEERSPDAPEKYTGVPWEAAGFIMQSIVELELIIKSNVKTVEELWPNTFDFFKHLQDSDIESERWEGISDEVRRIKNLLLTFENNWLERERKYRPLEI